MMDKELERKEIAQVEEVSVPSLRFDERLMEGALDNAQKIAQLFKERMVDGIHYAKNLFPGQQKPTLLDPGAQLIMAAFSVYPDHQILEHRVERVAGQEYVEYVVKCELKLRGFNVKVAEGLGSASSDEVKYRYRWLPEEELLETYGFSPEELERLPKREVAGKVLRRVRNPEILDLSNTLLKMAAKRSEIDAVMQLPGVSEIFTQDIGERVIQRRGSRRPPSAFEGKLREEGE